MILENARNNYSVLISNIILFLLFKGNLGKLISSINISGFTYSEVGDSLKMHIKFADLPSIKCNNVGVPTSFTC